MKMNYFIIINIIIIIIIKAKQNLFYNCCYRYLLSIFDRNIISISIFLWF